MELRNEYNGDLETFVVLCNNSNAVAVVLTVGSG